MRRTYLLACIVCVIALGVRFVPLTYSSLPYNIDGFSILNIVERTQESGHLVPLENDPNLPNYKVPVFSAWVLTMSDVLGVESIIIAQLVVPLLTLPVILAVFAFVRRLTRSDVAATFASLYLALEGIYVFSTATVIKASIAFALIPIILVLYWGREDRRKRFLASLLLVTLPLVHHGSSLITFTAISLLLSYDFVKWWREGKLTVKRFAVEVALGPALFIPGLLYYNSVDLTYLRQVDDLRQIVLFLSVFLFAVIIYRMLVLPSKARRSATGGGTRRLRLVFDNKLFYPLGAVALLVANSQTNVFTGTITTTPAFLNFLVFYFLLVVLCLIGFNLIRHFRNGLRPLAMAIIVAAFTTSFFAFFRGLDPLSFVLMYRSFPFMAYGVAMCAGVSIAFLFTLRRSRAFKAVVATTFVTLLVLSLPFGYNSEQMYQVENATAQYEFEAMTFVAGTNATYVGTDQRIQNVLTWYYQVPGDFLLPDEIARGSSSYSYDFALVFDFWSTQGAQVHPMPNVVIDDDTMTRFEDTNNVVYSITSPVGSATLVKIVDW